MKTLVLESIWKAYPRWPAGTRTVRAIVSRRAPLLVRRGERRWALQDVSLELRPGEGVGVVGANGAGKSTLLRLASGLGRPTRGRVLSPDGTASVLSLGTWFDSSLTGRENALTALIVHGWRSAQARALVPAVLEFAELEEFGDAPVRTYSEGMKLRLAFGVVAQLEPEVLLMDEVMSVGDLSFQGKCVERIGEMRSRGTALLLASHDLDQVAGECDRAVWLDAGRVRAVGDAHTVVARYRESGRQATLERTRTASADGGDGPLELGRNRFGGQELTIEDVTLRGADRGTGWEVKSGTSLTVALELCPRSAPIENPIVQLRVFRAGDDVLCFESSSDSAGLRLGLVSEPVGVEMVAERLDLMPGEYVLDLGVYPSDWAFAYDYHWHAYRLTVAGPTGGDGVVRPPHRWARASGGASGQSRGRASTAE